MKAHVVRPLMIGSRRELIVVLHPCHADPENKLYDLLKLNAGIKETFFTPSTPLAFLKRFTKPDGTKELSEVLSKWNKGKNTRRISPRIFHPAHLW
jgi:hypothetical protein